MIKFINELMNKIIDGHEIDNAEAMTLLKIKDEEVPFLMGCASIIKNYFWGDKVKFCAILNAKSGNCTEDCTFCAQSGHNRASVDIYPLVTAEEMLNAAHYARKINTSCFGIVTSGESISKASEQDVLIKGIELIKSHYPDMETGVSIGKIDRNFLRRLIDAGLTTVHHNLETSGSYFENICTTHSYNDKLDFLNLLREENVKICSGGIIGLGESPEDHAELAFTLRNLKVQTVPLNFLNPILGTKLEKMQPGKPMELLKTIAFFRFVLPKQHIQICGGRNVNFRTLQPAIFLAGANGMMVGNYLTTAGQDPKNDLQIVGDLNLNVEF
jgi:biotin synthase